MTNPENNLNSVFERHANKTTAELLKKNYCYCNHLKKVIKLNDCNLLDDCRHDKKCRDKSIKNFDKNTT